MSTTDAAIRARWTVKRVIREQLLAKARAGLDWARAEDRHPRQWRVELVAKREKQVAEARRVIANHKPTPLRTRAYKIAAAQVGVMESGGNNRGTPFLRFIKANGGTAPEPWCGDFLAYVYSRAGSLAVTRNWASVRLLGLVAGVRRTHQPQRGDLVRFKFDHVGMFSKWVNKAAGIFETIEGNTGATGAVSDGNGHDGVYRKQRSMADVQDFLVVTR